MESSLAQPLDLPYAQPAPSYGHKVFAGVAILLAELGLIVLGGCFLIGVMIVSNRGFDPRLANVPLAPPSVLLMIVLYALAGISFAAATLVLLAGLRALFRVM